ncbi:MAG: septation protein SepH [Acidimicrobiales bacterium]
MRKLHLIGATADAEGLIFTARKGSKSGGFVVDIDPHLVRALVFAARTQGLVPEGLVPSPPGSPAGGSDGPGSRGSLSPREIQARLRAGRSIEQVATEGGVDQEWVSRFAVPILAEQAQVVELARTLVYAKPRAGDSSQDLADSVVWNLSDRGIWFSDDEVEHSWSAYQLHDAVWMVRFAFKARGRQQEALWELDVPARRLVARNRLAGELGFVEQGRKRDESRSADAIVEAVAKPGSKGQSVPGSFSSDSAASAQMAASSSLPSPNRSSGPGANRTGRQGPSTPPGARVGSTGAHAATGNSAMAESDMGDAGGSGNRPRGRPGLGEDVLFPPSTGRRAGGGSDALRNAGSPRPRGPLSSEETPRPRGRPGRSEAVSRAASGSRVESRSSSGSARRSSAPDSDAGDGNSRTNSARNSNGGLAIPATATPISERSTPRTTGRAGVTKGDRRSTGRPAGRPDPEPVALGTSGIRAATSQLASVRVAASRATRLGNQAVVTPRRSSLVGGRFESEGRRPESGRPESGRFGSTGLLLQEAPARSGPPRVAPGRLPPGLEDLPSPSRASGPGASGIAAGSYRLAGSSLATSTSSIAPPKDSESSSRANGRNGSGRTDTAEANDSSPRPPGSEPRTFRSRGPSSSEAPGQAIAPGDTAASDEGADDARRRPGGGSQPGDMRSSSGSSGSVASSPDWEIDLDLDKELSSAPARGGEDAAAAAKPPPFVPRPLPTDAGSVDSGGPSPRISAPRARPRTISESLAPDGPLLRVDSSIPPPAISDTEGPARRRLFRRP